MQQLGIAAMTISGSLHDLAKAAATRLDRLSRLGDRYSFEDRSEGRPLLVYMLIGYKKALWPFVLPRFRAAIPPETDVCLVSPGLEDPEIAGLAAGEGWSYLATSTNDVSLAQNICLSLHDSARLVCKVDEDMFLLPDTIAQTMGAYLDLRDSGVANPGFMAPVIPLNGLCYRWLLERLDLLDAFEAEFGVARMATSGAPIHVDTRAAEWIWRRTSPLEATAARLSGLEPGYLYCPVQFSIGTIVFERSFWEEIGMLPVHRRRRAMGASTLGGDEAYLCKAAVENARPGVVTTRALAGHFSFGPQFAGMSAVLEASPELFRPPVAKRSLEISAAGPGPAVSGW